VLVRLLAVAQIETQVDQGHRDAKPEQQQRDHGGKGHGTARRLVPDEEVQKESSAVVKSISLYL